MSPSLRSTLAALFGVRYYTLERRHVTVKYDTSATPRRDWVTPKEADYLIDADEVVRMVGQIVGDMVMTSRIEL